MKSVKLHEDTVSVLRAIKTRQGGSYDDAIAHVLQRHADSTVPALNLTEQLDRMEILLLEIRDLLKRAPDVSAPAADSAQTFVIQ